MAWLGYFPTNVKYNKDVYSRFTLLSHRAKIINDHYDKVKFLAPFGENYDRVEKWSANRAINFDDLMDVKLDQFDRAHTSFDIQPEQNTSYFEENKQLNKNIDNEDRSEYLNKISNPHSFVGIETSKSKLTDIISIVSQKNISMFAKRTSKDVLTSTKALKKDAINQILRGKIKIKL